MKNSMTTRNKFIELRKLPNHTNIRRYCNSRWYHIKRTTGTKAYLHLNWLVSKQNDRFWNIKNPAIIHEQEIFQSQITCWCNICAAIFISLYHFEGSSHAENYTGLTKRLYTTYVSFHDITVNNNAC